jgi:hypothetical protein
VVVVGVRVVGVEHPRLHHGVEDLAGEELVAQLAVEALHEGILPGTAGQLAINVRDKSTVLI